MIVWTERVLFSVFGEERLPVDWAHYYESRGHESPLNKFMEMKKHPHSCDMIHPVDRGDHTLKIDERLGDRFYWLMYAKSTCSFGRW